MDFDKWLDGVRRRKAERLALQSGESKTKESIHVPPSCEKSLEERAVFNPENDCNRRTRFNITLPQEIIDYLRWYGYGNASAAIVKLVIAEQKRQLGITKN